MYAGHNYIGHNYVWPASAEGLSRPWTCEKKRHTAMRRGNRWHGHALEGPSAEAGTHSHGLYSHGLYSLWPEPRGSGRASLRASIRMRPSCKVLELDHSGPDFGRWDSARLEQGHNYEGP